MIKINYQKNSAPGYILILTMIMIGLATALLTRMFYQGSALLPLANLTLEREAAKNFALSGVQLALSQLNHVPEASPEKDLAKPSDPAQLFLEHIKSKINRWQEFVFVPEVDGFAGKIRFYLACEDGKINLNQFYDFTKKAFKNPAYEQALPFLIEELGRQLKNKFDAKLALDSLRDFLASRTYQLLDPSELILVAGLAELKEELFTAAEFSLDDIFTTSTMQLPLEAQLLSKSMRAILGFPSTDTNDIMKRAQALAQETKINLFVTKPNPQVFSVIASGHSGRVTQKVRAIIRARQADRAQISFVLEKLTWV